MDYGKSLMFGVPVVAFAHRISGTTGKLWGYRLGFGELSFINLLRSMAAGAGSVIIFVSLNNLASKKG